MKTNNQAGASGPSKQTKSQDNSELVTSAMLDLTYSEKDKVYICGPGQAFPFWDVRKGYLWDVRACLYTALSWRYAYYTDVKGECLTEAGAYSAGREDAILGYGYGFRELIFRNSPPGTFCEPGIDANVPGIMDHPLRVVDFCRLATGARTVFDTGMELMPIIYYPVPSKSKEQEGDVAMWTPDKGRILMRKAQLPFVVTPFDMLMQWWGYDKRAIRNFASQYKGMVLQWCDIVNAPRLYVGRTYEEPVVDHLIDPAEYTSDYHRLIKSTPYSYPDIWGGIDVNRTKLRMCLHNQQIVQPQIHSGW